LSNNWNDGSADEPPSFLPGAGAITEWNGVACLLSKAKDKSERTTSYTVEALSMPSSPQEWIGINQVRAKDYVEHFLKTGQLEALTQTRGSIARCSTPKKLGVPIIALYGPEPLRALKGEEKAKRKASTLDGWLGVARTTVPTPPTVKQKVRSESAPPQPITSDTSFFCASLSRRGPLQVEPKVPHSLENW